MINETLKLSGELTIVLKDKDGKVKEERKEKNLVVDSGLDFICSRMAGTASSVMGYMAVGSDNTAAAAGQTDLLGYLGTRIATDNNGTATNNTVTYTATFGAGVSSGAIVEAGIFNDPSVATGDMLCRTVFATVNKGAEDTMSITWTITLSAA